MTPPATAYGLEPAGFFSARSSLLPWDAFLAFEDRASLRALVADPAVREAIFLASPSLEESLEYWERDPSSERGKKVELSLVKYVARLSSRATPFGLFAGVSLGTIG